MGAALGEADADAGVFGAAVRASPPEPEPVPVRVPVPADSSAGVRVAPPCVVSSGACRASVATGRLLPALPAVRVSPPGRRPVATATAPTATAAEAPSSPVRTGWPRRLRRAPP
ncbi:hypothetical protein [Streptomyces filamentosus]|uniref:hypothetical protein n=1 Tax=Streptomyces filamentosus TaxID=67294 RepID=UPI003B51A72E